jgi:SAM-dependent methyltransferase
LNLSNSLTPETRQANHHHSVPPNCRFEVDDAEDEWTFSTKFDFIHGRALLSCFNDSKHVFQQAYNALVPGGYLELQDGIFPMQYVGDVPENCALKKWNELILGGAAKAGRAWTNVQHYKRFLEEIGFEDVEEKSFYWPTSPWAKGKHAKQLAMYFQEDMLTGIEGMTLKVFTGVLGWTPEQVQVFLVDVRKDLKDLNIHAYLRV